MYRSVWFVLGGKGGLGEIRCLSKSKQLAVIKLVPNKGKLLPKNKPHRTELFLLNLKKKLHSRSQQIFDLIVACWTKLYFAFIITNEVENP